MFPDSEIAKQFHLGKDKISYLVNFGLAPFFQSKFNALLKTCVAYTVIFDEAFNKISQKGQMDIILHFYNIEEETVCTMYYNSVFLGRARATEILESFKLGLKSLPLDKMINISMDGPNANWKFIRLLETELW